MNTTIAPCSQQYHFEIRLILVNYQSRKNEFHNYATKHFVTICHSGLTQQLHHLFRFPPF